MHFRFLLLFLLTFTGAAVARTPVYDLVVAQDGSGQYHTIGAALAAVPDNAARRTTIYIKAGIYREKLVVPAAKVRVSLIGAGPEKTIITYDDHAGKGNINTMTSYTVLVKGRDFRAANLTFENSAGREAGQAVALHVEADRCAFFNCRIVANQDTYFAAASDSRQYLKDCYLEGTTDFIFGAATVLFEDCTIHSKKNSYITAASTPPGQAYGLVFRRCQLTAVPEASQVYLGRPWRNHARTVFLDCDLGAHLLPAGWHNWKKPEAEQTAFYAEYRSRGPGGESRGRVPWSRQLRRPEARRYTRRHILAGPDNWDPRQD